MNYKNIANKYDERYKSGQLSNIEILLSDIIKNHDYKEILEVGCGTGHWLQNLQANIFGCDLSYDMLKIAQSKNLDKLIMCDAVKLPFRENSFDFIFLVNALHQFDNKVKFIEDAFKLLKSKGCLAIFYVDPSNHDDSWYVYEYFDGVYEKDLRRFPRWSEIVKWMNQIGFNNVSDIEVEKIYKKMIAAEVFNDNFLLKYNSSQLAELSDEAYGEGLDKIRKRILLGYENNTEAEFITKITYKMILGIK